MHLRDNGEGVQWRESLNAGENTHANSIHVQPPEHTLYVSDRLMDPKSVDITIRHEQELERVTEVALAGWILLLHRYHHDSIPQCTWGTCTEESEQFQCLSAADMGICGLSTVEDLLARLQRLRPTDITGNIGGKKRLVFRHGGKEQWTFEISMYVCKNTLRATPRWQPPFVSQSQAIRQLRSFASIAKNILQRHHNGIAELLALSEEELEDVWNWNSPLPPTIERCMHQLISEKAKAQPGKLAIEAWDGSLTYAEVDQYSNELGQNLRLLIDSPDQIIPVLFEKSRWTVVAVLAVMKCGACFALLDPAQPEGRLRTIVEQTEATIILASESQTSLATRIARGATVVPVSESKFLRLYRPFAKQQPNGSLPPVRASAPLYIQFTSGSTGVPKGCVITHTQFTSGAIPRAHTVGYRAHSRVLDFASYAFDVSIDSMLCTLANGGTLCTPSEGRRMNDLSGAMRDMHITLAGMTPSVARTLDPDILPSLETLAVGGEGVSYSDVATWRKKTRIINCYGPSECTVGAAINGDVGSLPYITMGNGHGCALWIADPTDHNNLVPPGAVGELLIEGPIVGNGYLKDPMRTKEVFIEDPDFLLRGSATMPGRRGRLYKTGDLVRYDPDGRGEVIFVGRRDQQVKLRGQRIELAEIEYNMRKHLPSDCQLAAEIIKPGGNGEPTLVAYIVEAKQPLMERPVGDVFASFSTTFHKALQETTRRLGEVLPGYMVPSAYIPLWKMPLLVSCKTDRKTLREIGASIMRKDLRRFSTTIPHKKQPETGMQRRLNKLWAQILGGDADFATSDNFFGVGGDSLRAMRLVAAARKDGVRLTVPDIMLNPTLSAMASKAELLPETENLDAQPFCLLPKGWSSMTAQGEAGMLCAVDTSQVEDVYPCTPLQEGLMALSAKFVDAYVAQRVVELPLQAAERLTNALHKVAKDSPILRTRIVNIPGHGLLQVVLKDSDMVREHGTELADYLKRDREEPMELRTALFRYGIVHKPGSGTAHVVITMHHAVYDGWSMPLVLDRVNHAYNGRETPRPVPFKHFIKHLAQLDTDSSQQYWREQLEGASPHQFPTVPNKGYITQADSLLEHYVTLPNLARSKLTLATTIRGAWAFVSSLFMGHTDIVFGETLTGRSVPVPGVEQIEGPMITTVPVRIKIDFSRLVSEYLESVHAETVQQIPHEHLGLQNIRRLSPDARAACDLRTGIVLHPREDGQMRNDALEDAPANGFLPSDDEEAAREALKFNTYALMLVCTLDENGFLVMASFDSNCVSSMVMQRVLRLLDRVITAFVVKPESRLCDVVALAADGTEAALRMLPSDPLVETKESMHQAQEQAVTIPQAETADESSLRKLLSSILSIPPDEVSLNHSFFELGGDSISAMRLVSEGRQNGLQLTVAQIFQSRSLSDLLAIIANAKMEQLIQLLSKVLKVPKKDIGPNDSFFELGGDSISAMRLVAEARVQGLKITVAHVFQSKSLSELASLAEGSGSDGDVANNDAPFTALDDEALSFSHDRLHSLLEDPEWDIADTYPARPLQQVAVEGTVQLPRYSLRYELITFAQEVDSQRLAKSCEELVFRNEVLRTVFVEVESRCVGVVLENLRPCYEEYSVPEASETEAFIRELVDKDIQAPKPYGSSFVAFFLITASSGVSTLVLRISHAQYDEICLPILFAQLAALYAGTPVPQTLLFSKHVQHVLRYSIPKSIPYWRNLLAGSHMTVLPPAPPLTAERRSTSIYREFDISTRPKDITIGTLPTAAWALVIARRLALRDVLFGEVVTGRNIGVAHADRIMGPAWQYIPFRVRFAPHWTYRDLLRFVQAQHVASLPHEGLSLSEIVRHCTDWDPEHVPWFDSVVHQAPREWTETLGFGDAGTARFGTWYPHEEPLREWKVQAFVKDGGRRLGIEVVCFEAWRGVGTELVGEIGEVLECFAGERVGGRIFEQDNVSERVTGHGVGCVKEGGAGYERGSSTLWGILKG